MAWLRREVRTRVERLTSRGEKDRHRPTALPCHRDGCVHVERVDVGALLTVDLHVDEVLVHQRRRRRALERLVGHHVTPVTGAVAHRQQDRPLLAPSPARAPRRPRDTSRPGCRRAGGGTGSFRRRGDSWLHPTSAPRAGSARVDRTMSTAADRTATCVVHATSSVDRRSRAARRRLSRDVTRDHRRTCARRSSSGGAEVDTAGRAISSRRAQRVTRRAARRRAARARCHDAGPRTAVRSRMRRSTRAADGRRRGLPRPRRRPRRRTAQPGRRPILLSETPARTVGTRPRSTGDQPCADLGDGSSSDIRTSRSTSYRSTRAGAVLPLKRCGSRRPRATSLARAIERTSRSDRAALSSGSRTSSRDRRRG